ncbi:uncharacterized protein BDZ83DRAFT_605457 [Colletotrichum acutatum]|uniref:Uncharacterized protein n=1 Tax=Glomerella acutata TaxID=27357 RepID=A0AAD9CZU4_GLOAC|nr:uncharacterized protein BDZ83DRAFT_605457 [Colletotrichum acutatum]KAK1729532.1 hypothetical protein BDZ83DRAFT_605457 [Colletotrichum acutatum]
MLRAYGWFLESTPILPSLSNPLPHRLHPTSGPHRDASRIDNHGQEGDGVPLCNKIRNQTARQRRAGRRAEEKGSGRGGEKRTSWPARRLVRHARLPERKKQRCQSRSTLHHSSRITPTANLTLGRMLPFFAHRFPFASSISPPPPQTMPPTSHPPTTGRNQSQWVSIPLWSEPFLHATVLILLTDSYRPAPLSGRLVVDPRKSIANRHN